jgi:hypothetical protein
MKTTLIFPSYLHLSGFMSVTDCANIEMDLRQKSLTGSFNENDISYAVNSFKAELVRGMAY